MSYHACVSGTITLTEDVQDRRDTLREICKALGYDFELWTQDGNIEVEFSGDAKWDEERVCNALNRLSDAFTITPGSQLSFTGEDEDDKWAYSYQIIEGEGGWTYLKGTEAYVKTEMPTYDELLTMFVNYVTADTERSGDPDYITKALEACGCNEKFRKAMGLDFPEDQKTEKGKKFDWPLRDYDEVGVLYI